MTHQYERMDDMEDETEMAVTTGYSLYGSAGKTDPTSSAPQIKIRRLARSMLSVLAVCGVALLVVAFINVGSRRAPAANAAVSSMRRVEPHILPFEASVRAPETPAPAEPIRAALQQPVTTPEQTTAPLPVTSEPSERLRHEEPSEQSSTQVTAAVDLANVLEGLRDKSSTKVKVAAEPIRAELQQPVTTPEVTTAPLPVTSEPPRSPQAMPPVRSADVMVVTVPERARAYSVATPPPHPMRKRFAYMFYVTKDIYGCAALHLIDNLVNSVHMNLSQIELVVLHTNRVSQRILANIQTVAPVRLILVDIIDAETSDPTWLESLTKLNTFRDWGYDRVVYLDADGVPTQNLDHLFDLPPNVLYAPTAYWLPQPFFASTVLVIEPSDKLFDAILSWSHARGAAAGFDMDILNVYFADTVKMLPGDYTVLNGEFRAKPDKPNKLYSSTTELKKHALFIHFSQTLDGSYGKPWTMQSHDLSAAKEQGFDPLFAEMFEAYWTTEEKKCNRS